MKKRLVILSDLWGKERSEWLINYTKILKKDFDIKYYDCCELGGVEKSDYDEDKLHSQFVNGGIERAVGKLIELEKNTVDILSFSIGGAVAWKYGIRSGMIDSIICVSSTRLRYETMRPKGEITLLFGSNDMFKPQEEWFDNMSVNYDILIGKGHQLYTDSEFAEQLSEQMIEGDIQTAY